MLPREFYAEITFYGGSWRWLEFLVILFEQDNCFYFCLTGIIISWLSSDHHYWDWFINSHWGKSSTIFRNNHTIKNFYSRFVRIRGKIDSVLSAPVGTEADCWSVCRTQIQQALLKQKPLAAWWQVEWFLLENLRLSSAEGVIQGLRIRKSSNHT